MKHVPYVGEKLYVHQKTGNMWIDEVHRPYTVTRIVNDNIIVIQAAKCIFNGPAYYNSLPDEIVEDPNGREMFCKWSEKKQRWQESPADGYPYICEFGKYDYQPYFN